MSGAAGPGGARLVPILTTAAGSAEAVAIADGPPGERLAACVQWHGIESRYRWQGRIEQATEQRLHIKTSAAASVAAVDRLRALHPHAVPEIVVLHAEAGAHYLRRLPGETGS